MFVSLGCLAMLAISAPACGADGVDSTPDENERAALDSEVRAAQTPSALEIVPESEPDALELVQNPAVLPSPNDVWIESVKAFGVGCPDMDSAKADISPDRKSFIVIFKDMVLENPGGSPIKTTNCLASIALHIPGGWQVSVATINTRGYAFLEKGLKARNTTSYFFAGDPLEYKAHSELKGYFDDFYIFTDQVPFQSVVWSPCGTSALFEVNTTLTLNALANPGGFGIFNTTNVDGRFEKIFHMQWKKC
jgi:hypothetical protein